MLALALLLFAGAAPAVDREAATSALLKGLVADGEPGLAVLVRKNGRTVFERGYGVRDLRSRAPIDARTRFRLASVTKQMTAAAIMTLVRDDRLRYEDTLTQALPGFPAYGSGVTFRHLLTHTSGLPDYEQLMEKAEKEKGTIWTPENQIRDDEVLALLEKETRGLFTPGTSWAYSNSGYVVLGLAAARAAGKPFGNVLRERIFTPLGMTRTLAYEKGKNEVPARAYGHTKEAAGFRETDQSSTSATLGDGGVYSCLEDLAKWDAALRTNALLSKEEMAAALTPVRLSDGSQPLWPKGDQGGDNLFPGQPVAYGFGWFLDPWQGRPRAWHHGETMGFRSIVERFPADGLSVVVLANRADIDLKSLALEIAEAQFGGAQRGDAPHEDRIPAGGATLYARDVGRGQPIVVLHGGPDFDHTYLLPDLDRLADAFRLIYYDQRGRGRSADGVRAEDVTLASDIADVDKVREHYRLASTAVLGHSFGTVLALEYAIRHPERVSHLILMNPAPASAADYKQFRKERLEKLGVDLDRLRAIAATDAYQAGDPDAVAAYYRIHFKAALQRPEDYERLMTLMRPSFPTSEAILKARHVEDRLMADTWSLDGYDLLPKLRSLKIPTLVIYGDHDFIPSYVAEHIAEALPAARFVTMKECGHFAYLECPGPVRKEIEGFLRNPAPARPR
jgi:proline iminopeptidase